MRIERPKHLAACKACSKGINAENPDSLCESCAAIAALRADNDALRALVEEAAQLIRQWRDARPGWDEPCVQTKDWLAKARATAGPEPREEKP